MKQFILTFSLFISSQLLFSQIGINTTTPDPSSALDISSTNSGVLAPRMTSAQRLAITSPATSLLVFDTDENEFYYYEGSTWIPLGSSQMRDNYKLVKSIADLADESTGSAYVLNTDFLYEINGTILVDLPIDINGAYIEGVDSGEDILVNASGGALFQGTGAGSIRNITLSGNGSPIFDLTGTGSELLIVNNTVLAGASSVGSISSVGTAFFSITQYVGNGNGFTLSNIGSFLMNTMFWTESNSGTFITASGSFDNFQMGNGRIEADAGETGLDVSANPTIVNEAALSEISFIGAGTRVQGYTVGSYPGYNFNTNWNVSCSGIPTETDEVAVGDLNFNFTAGGGAGTTFPANGTPRKLQGTTTTNNLFRFSETGSNRIIYEGKERRFFEASASISFEGSQPGDRFIFYIARGRAGDATATVIDETGAWKIVSNAANRGGGVTVADISVVPVIGVFDLEPNDYIEVWAERFSGTGSIFTVALNLAVF
ncbi:cell wall anchor protein [Dokdonia sp. Hel_I_53]|uniref:cell wall anchor protein n=1 Tax=Dokdonia sp. Hel_I_53 TaxID=1566287 RepID=UPI00119C2B7C|nr:cell wall anchor protein [Dokdonia sp. Hel_I_53]TVZ52895.1 hypothetical protein OD90_2081 [Dokdonia sp. Hel_I_53]